MARVTAYSRVILADFVVNEQEYMAYLSKLTDYRNELMKGNDPILPSPVTPVYSKKGSMYKDKGVEELKNEVEKLNSLPEFSQRGLILSFESNEFAWGHTPLRLRHLSCGRISIVRAYTIYRKLKDGDIDKIACAKRQCYESMTGIKLAPNSATPWQAGATPSNATPIDDVGTAIEQQSGGALKLVPGGFKGMNKAIAIEVSHEIDDYPVRYAVLSSHSNCTARDVYAKTAKRLAAGKKLDSRTAAFSSADEALAYAHNKW